MKQNSLRIVGGNDSQYQKLVDQFNSAKKRLKTSGAFIGPICVIGCCYGKSNPKTEYKTKGYHKMCGQRFWETILAMSVSLFTVQVGKAGIVNVDTTVQEKNIAFPTDPAYP